MVATPYIEKQIRNYKAGKNKVRDKKEKHDKARHTMYFLKLVIKHVFRFFKTEQITRACCSFRKCIQQVIDAEGLQIE